MLVGWPYDSFDCLSLFVDEEGGMCRPVSQGDAMAVLPLPGDGGGRDALSLAHQGAALPLLAVYCIQYTVYSIQYTLYSIH